MVLAAVQLSRGSAMVVSSDLGVPEATACLGNPLVVAYMKPNDGRGKPYGERHGNPQDTSRQAPSHMARPAWQDPRLGPRGTWYQVGLRQLLLYV